jgi:glycosyltransferase involved in cell wall biosynthesis
VKSLAIISSQAFSLINFRGQLIADLVAKGTQVFALAPDYTDDLRLSIHALGAVPIDFHLTRTGMSPWRDLRDMLLLTMLLRRLSPDAALTYFIKPVIYGTLAAWMARVPHRVAMIEGLGYVFTSSGEHLPWVRRLLRSTVSVMYRVALSRAQRVVFLNRDDIFEFTTGGLVTPDKVEHIEGIGVDLNYWGVANAVVSPTTFVLAARLLREKGIIEFAQAAARVKTLHPTARFILLGALDPNPGSLDIDEIKSWVRSGTIEWPGHVDPKPCLAQASVYVLPSYREGLPRSTLEAMAMGRAVITTDVPGCRETVVDGVNGFLVPKCDVLALAEAMLKFIDQPERVAVMGQASRRMVEARFDVKKINPQLLRILDPGSSPIRRL